ncbi:NADH dehydrogenase [ubiquinone] 1 alpha subcomplex assembly factor 4 [Procambarus clarkii]|uniref:NADH dehydrogenase [ubiquinone] 1 alpha subcomplex assembly factor 4 n=1 Tax=Procambarus clarkii TaxID=6728 RepID=UPI001E676176|nr:NADH dehydrogenase [ubiquinone] 1 alpha subcomplex assembly factor 4-like [Procambarus clarkii]
MGKIISLLSRRATKPLREYNLDSRVFKEIAKEKRPVAPWHKSTIKLIEDSIKAQPKEVARHMEEKDDFLLERLKEVFVTSENPLLQQQITENPNRPLPTNRTFVSEADFGYSEPKVVPYGKIILRDAVKAISHHHEDPELWTAKKISYEYKLDTGLTEKVLQHFNTFVVIVPEDHKTKKMSEETLKNTPITASGTLKQLTSATNDDKSVESKGKG